MERHRAEPARGERSPRSPACPSASLVAWLLARGRFPGRALLDGIVHLPLVMPPVVTGYLLLLAFGRKGPVGAFLEQTFGIVLAFRWTGAALAAAIMGFPLMVRAIRLSIEAIDPRLEAAAATLGASRLGVLADGDPAARPPRHPRRRWCSPSPARSASSAPPSPSSATSPASPRPIPTAIYTDTQVPGGELPALRLTAIAVVIAFAALLVSETLARRVARRTARRDDARRSTSTRRWAASRSTAHFASGGGVTALFGRSGAGKTHAGQRSSPASCGPTAARIRLDGTALVRHRRGASTCRRTGARVGYVFQEGRLFPHYVGARQPDLRPPAHARRRDRWGSFDHDRRPARHRAAARPAAGEPVRRREAAGRHRPRAAGEPAPAADGRAAGLARRRRARTRSCPTSNGCATR